MSASPTLTQPSLFVLPQEPLGPDQLGVAKVSEILSKQILTKANGSMKDYDYSLNPYVGCGFACRYCFASFFQAEQDRFDSWGTWIEIKSNAAELLKKKRDLKGARIFMSSATDPYQPLEMRVGLTRSLVEIMSEPLRQPSLVVQTRSPMVTRDIDLFKKFRHVRINMSITTDSEEVRKQFEPSCASIDRRLEAVAQVTAAGLRATVCMCPMLPMQNPREFANRLKESGANHFVTAYFHTSDRQFAANTRPEALDLAKKLGWSREAYQETVKELRSYFPRINDGSGGWEPADVNSSRS